MHIRFNMSRSANESIDGCETIYIIAKNMEDVNEANVLNELASYRSPEGLWNKLFVWSSADSMQPKLWWQTFYPQTDLGKVALRVLTVRATSASVERSFSTFSQIHCKKRNKLDTTRAGKLCYIAHNWKILGRGTKTSNTDKENHHQSETAANIIPPHSTGII